MGVAAIGILGTIAGALVAGGIALFSSMRQERASASMEAWKLQLDRCRTQLSDLYAPLLALRSVSRSLRALLPSEVNGAEWRLVHHVGTIRKEYDRLAANPASHQPAPALGLTREQINVAKLIVDNGAKAAELLRDKASLVEGHTPAGILQYSAHQVRLKDSWDTGINQSATTGMTFPGQLVGIQNPPSNTPGGRTSDNDVDVAILEGVERVEAKRDGLLAAGPKQERAMLPIVLMVAGVVIAAIAVVVAATAFSLSSDPVRLLVRTDGGWICGDLDAKSDGGIVKVEGRAVPAGAEPVVISSCNVSK
jgi:hypothetical protein